jgi:hypothetical protein
MPKKDAEMCVLNEEVSNYDEVFMKRAFWKKGLDVVYDSAEGRYVVSVDRRNIDSAKDGDDDDADEVKVDVVKPAKDLEKEQEEQEIDSQAAAQIDKNFAGVVQLVVFAVDKKIEKNGESMYHRVGWKRRLLPPDCEYSKTLECFPQRLVLAPLPLKLFGTRAVPVPREEFELLKYHFPDNWWKEVNRVFKNSVQSNLIICGGK